MAYNYVATAQKPTSVTHSLTAAFTGPNDTNLLLAKSTRFEVHLLTPEGLSPQHDVNLYGRIAIFEVFRALNEPQDWLFIVTQRFQFCVLAYDAAAQQFVTKAHGSIRDSIGRSSEIVTSGNIDPEGRLIGMNLYEGYFKVIPIDSGKGILKDTFNIRLDELRVIDIKFLHGYTKPTICVLYEDYKAARHIKTYHILLKEKDFAEGPWSQSNVESGASLLIPVPAPVGACSSSPTRPLCITTGARSTPSPCRARSFRCTAPWTRTDRGSCWRTSTERCRSWRCNTRGRR